MTPEVRESRRDRGLYWDHAWKLVEGCTKVSPGCDNCWSEAETVMRSYQHNATIRDRALQVTAFSGADGEPIPQGRFTGNILLREDNLDLPLRKKSPLVFAIWNDLFHEDVPDEFLDRAYAVMALCPQHTFLVLTKRPDRMAEYWASESNTLRRIYHEMLKINNRAPDSKPNVYHGTTVESQEQADKRIPYLLQVPGKRFLSIEPMLGPIDLLNLERPFDFHRSPYGWPQWLGRNLHQVLLGGESGKNARPMHPDWARSVRDQCEAAGVPFMFKQWGEWLPDNQNPQISGESGDTQAIRVGKKKAGRLLDGKLHDELAWDGSHGVASV